MGHKLHEKLRFMARDDILLEAMPRKVLNRHWVWIALWYGAGILCARHLPGPVWLLAVCFGMGGVAVLFIPNRLPRRAHWGVAFLCLALGAALYGLRMPGVAPDALGQYALSYPRGRFELEGVVKTSPIYSADDEYTTFVLHVDRASRDEVTVPLPGRTVVRWTRPAGPVFAGTRVCVTGRLSPHLGTVNHGLGGIETFYRAQRVYSELNASGDAVALISVNRVSPRYWVACLRQDLHERLSRVIPPAVYPFVLGVWLGERSRLNHAIYQRFIHAGTAHVLAVSGLHVGIITLSLFFLLKLLRMPPRLRILLVMTGVAVFVLMTGARTATTRAALMICLYYMAELFGRERDSLSTIGLAGVIFLVWNPAFLFDTGFLLSFGSVAAIILFYPGLSRVFSWCPQPLRALVATSLAVQAVTIPIAAWHFNIVPLLGLLANLAVVPLLTVVLWLSLATSLLGVVLPAVAVLPGHALLPVIKAVEGANAAVLSLPGAYAVVTRPGLAAVFLYAASVGLLFPLLYDPLHRKRNAVLVGLLVLASLVAWNISWKRPGVDVLDVGTGDAIFVRTPGGTTLLVDGGDTSQYTDAGARVVAPFLHANRIKALDYVLVSHPDRDHIGGLFTVLKQFRIGTVLLGPEAKAPVPLETEFIAQCHHHGIPVKRLEQGDRIPMKGAEIQVLHPSRDWAARHTGNNNSVVLHLSWPGLSLLLPGDVEEEAETELLPHLAQPASILKAPHHGSPTSSSEAFLEKVNPTFAVASMQAAGARQTLMTPAMVRRYADHGITLFRTDWHGGVRIQPTRGGLHVQTARGMRGYCLKPVSL